MDKKPFALFLSALTKLLALGSCVLTLFSCSPNANVQTKGMPAIQGEWQQHPEAVDKQLVNYTLYNFTFTCDSFYVSMQTHSKVNYGADTCMNKGYWTEYAKGRYQPSNDTLWIRGFFCNQDYSLKNTGGCFRSGVYEDFMKAEIVADTLLRLTPKSSVLPLNLHLVKRTNCVPKPL